MDLPTFSLSKPMEEELSNLPHVVLTSDEDWDPHVLDHQHDLDDDNVWYNVLQDPDPGVFHDPHFSNTGDYIACSLVFDLYEDDVHVQSSSPMTVAETIDHLNHELHLHDNIDPLQDTIHIQKHC